MFHKFTLGIICLTLCFAIPLKTSAASPESGGGSYFFEADPLVFCDDFWILDDTLMKESWRYFYDNDGNLVRAAARYSFDDDLYHEDFPDGIHLYGSAGVNHQWVFENDDVWHKVSGRPVAITVPGYGPMYFDAGQFVFLNGELEFVAGKNHNYLDGEVDAICDYFRNQ